VRIFIISITTILFFIGCSNESQNKIKKLNKSVPFILNEQIQIQQQVVPSNLKSNARYGSAVSVNDGYLAVGAEYGDGLTYDSGTVYIYKDNGNGNYVQISQLKGTDTKEWNFFGNSVSISGNYVAVGAYLEGTVGLFGGIGTTYIFKNDENDNFNQVAKLAPAPESATPYGFFGNSVSMDGNYTLIGAEFADGNVKGDSVGVAYIFKNDGNDNFSEIAKLIATDSQRHSQFGRSVDLDGDYAVIGAVRTDGEEENSGAVYVFKNSGSDSYTQIAKLTPTEAEKEDFFGAAVAINGDYIAVGAYGDDSEAVDGGAVYIFKNSGNDSYTQIAKITVEDANIKDWLGYSVDIKGSRVVAGAIYSDDTPLENSGAVYIFENDGNDNYTQTAKLSGYNSLDNLGNSVAISDNHIVMGTMFDDTANNDSGSAYIAGFNDEGGGLHFLNYKPNWSIDEDINEKLFTINAISQNEPINYSLLGEDSIYFDVNSSGEVTFNQIPDFENPLDSDGDNIYELSIVLNDQTNTPKTFNQSIKINDKIGANLVFEADASQARKSSTVAIGFGYAVYNGVIYKKSPDGSYVEIFQTGEEQSKAAISEDYIVIAKKIDYYPYGHNSVKIFKNNGDDTFTLSQTLVSDFNDDASLSGGFGHSVIIQGDYLVISSSGEDSTYIYKKDLNGNFMNITRIDPYYKFEGDTNPIEMSPIVAMTQETIFVKAGNKYSSKVYILNNDGNDNYPSIGDAQSISNIGSNSQFANGIAADGDYLLIAGADLSGYGVVYLYKKDAGGNYTHISTIKPSKYDLNRLFGGDIKIKGNYIIIPSNNRMVQGTNYAGSVFLFKIGADDTVTQMREITQENFYRYSFFGSFVDFDGNNLAIANKPTLTQTPKMSIYELSE